MQLREKFLTAEEARELLVSAGFPELYLAGRWDEIAKAEQYKRWFYNSYITNRSERSVYVWGGVGSGKSTLAGLFALFLRRHFYGEILFTGCSEMISAIYHQTPASKYKECPVLIIDDLGKEYHHEYGISRLHEVTEHRYSRLMPTVVTSNLSQIDLVSKGGLWQSMGDRLRDEKWMMTMKMNRTTRRIP